MQYDVNYANQSQLDDIKCIADSMRDELGFTLRQQISEAIDKKEIIVAVSDCKVIGYTKFHVRRDKNITMYSLAVAEEYQLMGVGRTLVNSVTAVLHSIEGEYIRLKCPVDLNANLFYEKIGLSYDGIDEGKRRLLKRWRYENTEVNLLCGGKQEVP